MCVQVSDSAFEWSDGTTFNYKASITDSRESPGSNEASCVHVSPAGNWLKASCNKLLDGAICYTTAITTASQSKTAMCSLNTQLQRSTRPASRVYSRLVLCRCATSTLRVCSYETGAKTQAPPEAKGCPGNSGVSKWVQHEGHCYAFDMSFYNFRVHSMEQAKSLCQSMGEHALAVPRVVFPPPPQATVVQPFAFLLCSDAKLLSLKTKEENDFVSKYMFDDPLITSRVWLAMDVNAEGKRHHS